MRYFRMVCWCIGAMLLFFSMLWGGDIGAYRDVVSSAILAVALLPETTKAVRQIIQRRKTAFALPNLFTILLFLLFLVSMVVALTRAVQP